MLFLLRKINVIKFTLDNDISPNNHNITLIPANSSKIYINDKNISKTANNLFRQCEFRVTYIFGIPHKKFGTLSTDQKVDFAFLAVLRRYVQTLPTTFMTINET